MLPKLASHILHHTSRAAATAQNYTFRNVLGFQSPSTSSGGLGSWSGAGSSSWGSYGAGPGGAKYSSGSRFYSGYQHTGRAVTQANSATSQDSLRSQTDDDEELRSFRPAVTTQSRRRPRSNSLSLSGTGRSKRADSFGVLKTVQLHQARARHALARVLSSEPNDDTLSSSRAVHVRRNSISASDDIAISPQQPFDKPPPFDTNFSTDPAAPQTTIAPDVESSGSNGRCEGNTEILRRLEAVRNSGDRDLVLLEVENFRSRNASPTVEEYNLAISALISVREPETPITIVLETYNEMLVRQIVPNLETYSIMIVALSERDYELQRALSHLYTRQRINNAQSDAEKKMAQRLKGEDNFTAALMMLKAVQAIESPSSRLSLKTYNLLLRSCAQRNNLDVAISIFALLETSGHVPDVETYSHLMATYVHARDVKGAEEVFMEYRKATTEGRIVFTKPTSHWDVVKDASDDEESNAKHSRRMQMTMWVKMIQAYFRVNQPIRALDILTQMLESSAGVDFGPADVPLPCPKIYFTFIKGFIEMKDFKTALLWLDQMRGNSTEAGHPLDPMTVAPAPDFVTRVFVVEGLAHQGMIAELNPLFRELNQVQKAKGKGINNTVRIVVAEANIAYLRDNPSLSREEVDDIYNFIVDDVLVYGFWNFGTVHETSRQMILSLFEALQCHGYVSEGISIVQTFVNQDRHAPLSALESKVLHNLHIEEQSRDHVLPDCLSLLQHIVSSLLGQKSKVTLQQVLEICDLFMLTDASPSTELAVLCMDAYKEAIAEAGSPAALQLSSEAWGLLCLASCKLPNSEPSRLLSLLTDMNSCGQNVRDLVPSVSRVVMDCLSRLYGTERLDEALASINLEWVDGENKTPSDASPPSKASHTAYVSRQPVVDLRISRFIGEFFPNNPKVSVDMAYERYEGHASSNKFPTPEVAAQLLACVGRANNFDKVMRIYEDYQKILESLEFNKQLQSSAWFCIESAMIVALAHCGHVEKAHVHRQRIIDQGGHPSHDAYGTLIQYVVETTDDSANALALWNEAISVGVVPNIFMYNTIISKLSKARKADMALELFHQMRGNNVRPSPVTYGAVIAACCRVGDAQSAELLFDEMTSQRNYKPRVPPYNTMIQFYTHTVRNRDRALHYYYEMISAGVKPTAHTYKLLIDAYGMNEPVDIGAMERIFDLVVNDPSVKVQGVHWAALISAYGCVSKNLEKALEVFNSIANHPTTIASGLRLPDAVTFESLLNVIVTLRRIDLIPGVLAKLSDCGIHMTAYIANLLIKGYSDDGQIERSREIFESLVDPPTGLAAPNNHAPHDASRQAPVAPDAPVFREPSTWETMIRAELGNKNRDNALALLQRLQTRQFPQAVYHRISGIMLDEDVAPWSQPSSGPSSPASS